MVRKLKKQFQDKRNVVASKLDKKGISLDRVINIFTLWALVFGTVALVALVWSYVRPVQLAEIKVPVATDQANYAPGDQISGIFFGEIFYEGEVKVLREVFCKKYKGVITPPNRARDDDLYDTQSVPRDIEGLLVTIGNLPDDVPIGSNCVLQFTNIYRIQTPFGIRQETYQYYTQNFSIVTEERREQLECEAAGGKDCDLATDDRVDDEGTQQSSPDSPAPQGATSQPTNRESNQQPRSHNQSSDSRSSNAQSQREPAPRFERQCIVNFIVEVGCRQAEVN